MRLIEALCMAVVGLVSLGLEIVAFFVFVRLVTMHWRFRPLLAFDRVGQPLVDPLVATAQRAIPTDWVSRDPQHTKLVTAVTLLVVALSRFAINSVAYAVIIPL